MITIVAGGTGSVKLVRGFAALTDDITVIANVGDNIWIHGLYVCPDVDTIVYGLAGLLDEKRGWGIRNDTFECLAFLRKLGEPSWFSLGDRDFATHIFRTDLLRRGRTLSAITELARKKYSIGPKIIPATDDEVSTIISTGRGKMHLQEFWVKHRARPRVSGIEFKGSDAAAANPEAVDAIERSDVVVIAPGNPVSSIGPTIALAGIRKALERKRGSVVAISPLIGGRAISGPAAKYMSALGLQISPVGVATYYRSLIGNFVMSNLDHSLAPEIQSLDIDVYETDISMKDRRGEKRMARYLLDRVFRK
ncbi:MAG TPA: 2-phospho-L-lactate transferase [Nitrososphaera sp.]